MKEERPYFLERTLPTRVKKYMDENKYIDIETMTEYLMKTYREFKTKNKKVFMKSVEKAYKYENMKAMSDLVASEENEFENGYSSPPSPDVVEVTVQKPSPGFSIDKLYKSPMSRNRSNGVKKFTKTIDAEEDNPTILKEPKPKKKRKKNDIEEISSPDTVQVTKKRKFKSLIPEGSLDDMMGISSLNEMAFMCTAHLIENNLHSIAPKSVLITGPEGSGKTMFATCLGGDSKATLIRVPVSELSGPGVDGESLLKEAFREASSQGPCIILLENIDTLSSKEYGVTKGPDKKLCDQLKEAISEVDTKNVEKALMVFAETRYPHNIDPSLRSKFEMEVTMPALDKEARKSVLKTMCSELKEDFDFDEVAERTSSFVAGDLNKLAQKARFYAWKRKIKEKLGKNVFSTRKEFGNKYFSFASRKNIDLELQDFLVALPSVTPTLKKEGFPLIPDITWEDVGGLEDIKSELLDKIIEPIKYSKIHEKFGAKKPNGIMLWGPPGCGKTLLAKAVANHAGINFYAVMGPELLSMYQGESERAIREVFTRAASVAPCVIFFDEFDCICPRRNATGDSGSKMTIVNTLLVEMNGFNQRKDVYVMAATNRPDMVDTAALRPERFDTSIFIGLPDRKGRVAILNACSKNTKKQKLAPDVNLEEIADWCENFSGADCAQLVYIASKEAIREEMNEGRVSEKNDDESEEGGILFKKHFVSAIKRVFPSVGCEELKKYMRMKAKFEKSKKEGKEIVLQDDISSEDAKSLQ